MTITPINRDFRTLRHAYLEVKNFIEKEVGVEVLSLDAKIEDDLGCSGDDNLELLQKFVTKYKLDTLGFDYSRHFLSEGELFGSSSALFTVLALPFEIAFWILSKLTFGKIDLNKVKLFPGLQRQTLDLSFGDLLTWYLAGSYCLRMDIKVKIKNAV